MIARLTSILALAGLLTLAGFAQYADAQCCGLKAAAPKPKLCPVTGEVKGTPEFRLACAAQAKVKAAGLKFLTAKQLDAKIRSGNPPIVINVLDSGNFTKQRIKGSINVPLDQVSTLVPKIVPDKNAEIVVHCASYRCGASVKAGKALKALGYTNVADYKGGTQDWVKRGLPTAGGA